MGPSVRRQKAHTHRGRHVQARHATVPEGSGLPEASWRTPAEGKSRAVINGWWTRERQRDLPAQKSPRPLAPALPGRQALFCEVAFGFIFIYFFYAQVPDSWERGLTVDRSCRAQGGVFFFVLFLLCCFFDLPPARPARIICSACCHQAPIFILSTRCGAVVI